MLAALYVNYFNPNRRSDTHDGIRRQVYQRIEETLKRKRLEKEQMRAHLEDTLKRIEQKPEAKARMDLVLGPEPDVAVIVLNDAMILELHALYMDFLDDEEVILLAASFL